MHEGTYEDGALIECGVCHRQLHSLEPDAQLCDRCASEGWLEPKAPWQLRRGDIVARDGRMALVIQVDRIGRHWMVEVMPLPGQFVELHRGVHDRTFVHSERDDESATAEIARRLGA